MKPHNFNRTVCACDQCKACCKRQPGPLAPGDFERIVDYTAKTQNVTPEIAFERVKAQMWASPGALIKDLITGKVERVGSITPKFRRGRCVFLDEADRCSIHPVAPFGCAYFDTHMLAICAMPRSVWLASHSRDPEYQKLRNTLPAATHSKPQRY